ncbi:conserved membrane hypothetical protein [uncultured Paludibacter sp.]|uniref:O-antigen ligase-related domain-containing protein n=1 Tax=uncultured Paludibacter sp. TaxID=497635 RepID=A0A653AK95_9BACT|nr:conserved membrane hypothetical protein [uncultured Paludibacter sp.]
MILLFKRKNYWGLLPLILSLFIAFLLYHKNFSFDLIGFKNGNNLISMFFTAITILFSLSLILFFSHFRKQTYYKKLLLLGVALFFIVINFRSHLPFQFSVIFAVIVLIYFLFEKKIYRPNLLFISLFIYFGIDTISLLWTYNPEQGFHYWGNITPIAFIPILFCFFKLDKKDFELIVLLIFRFSIIFSFISICSWIVECRFLNFPLENSLSIKKYTVDIYNSYDVVYAWSKKVHPTYNALNFLFSLSVGWYYIFKKNIDNNVSFSELLFLILTSLLLSIITASRFLFVGWIVVNILGFLFVIRRKKTLLATCASCIIIFVALFMLFNSGEITNFVQDPVRKCHYNAAFQGIKENTWLGTGLGGMTKYINRDNPVYAPLHLSKAELFPHEHPHNEIIGDWMQTGIPGLVAILLILSVLFYYGIKQRNWLLLINAIIFFILMTIEMPLMYSNGIFAFTLIFSLLTHRIDTGSGILFNFNNKKNQIDT